jgi:hypothetical protein
MEFVPPQRKRGKRHVGNHNHVPVLLVDTGGTLSHHARFDSERTFDHGMPALIVSVLLIMESAR